MVGLWIRFLPSCFIPIFFSDSSKFWSCIEYHIHIWQVLSQLGYDASLKYDCDSEDLWVTYLKLKIYLAENIMNRALVPLAQDVFVPGPSLRILDSTRCQRTPLCHILLLNLDILQGSFRLCNWLSLRRLVSWINHLPPACWSTFRKSNSKQQLGCRFDIMDYESYFFLCFDICNYICHDTSYHFSVLPS